MNKKEFLKKLENSLMILNENERKDIINDYEEMINEKIKSGQTEKEAVDSFGDIDDVSKEILNSYKINTEYNKKVDAKKVIEDGENWIKKTARNLSDATIDFVDSLKGNRELSVELVFEILIKILIVLVVCAVLKLPFMIIEKLGISIFHIFDPFGIVLIFVWKLLVSLCYLVACVLVFFAFFKDNFKGDKESKKNKSSKKDNLKEDNEEEKIVVKRDKKTKKKDHESGIIHVFKWIIKFFVVICVLIPIVCSNIGIIIGLVYTLFFVIKGINIWGLLILLLGLSMLGWEVYNIIYTLTFKKIKICVWTLLIGAVLTGLGGILFVDNIMSFNYFNSISPNIVEPTTTSNETIISGPLSVRADNVVLDDTLEDNKLRIEVTYYDEYYTLNQEMTNQNTKMRIYLSPKNSDFNNFKKVYKVFLKDLKNKSVYNYEKIDDYTVTIYANSNTINLINE